MTTILGQFLFLFQKDIKLKAEVTYFIVNGLIKD